MVTLSREELQRLAVCSDNKAVTKIEPSTQQVCLSIAGVDPSGGAGIFADLKTFAAHRCYGTAVITSITHQNTTGVFAAFAETAQSVRGQFEAILDDIQVSSVKTGMLPTTEVIESVISVIKERALRNIVVDPVVRSTSGFDLIDDVALSALVKGLFPLADIVTPNLPEAERISGFKIDSIESLRSAADVMAGHGAKCVLIKGGHFGAGLIERGSARDHLFVEGREMVIDGEFFETTATHGTGCTLSAAIAARLALGSEIEDAVRGAKRYVSEAIRTAPMLGNGHSPINHLIDPFSL